MEVWQIVLYSFAALLALRSLAGLMTAHRRKLVRANEERDEALRQEEARLQAEATASAKRKSRRAGAA